jgi:hypothetical protein
MIVWMDAADAQPDVAADVPLGLDVLHERGFLSVDERAALTAYLTSDQVLWNRPRYASQ